MTSATEGDGDPGEEALVHVDALHNLARYLTRHAADAEDLVQETYARALRAWGQYHAGSDLRAWLFRILRNTFLERVRHDRRGAAATLAGAGAPEEPGPDAWLRGDQELDRMRRLVAEDIEAALRKLGEEARTIVLLDQQGLTEREVALVMGCAVGTVKSRLHRARAALRAELSAYGR